jgi:serine O-acetyltransferase
MSQVIHPRNPTIRNTKIADAYLWFARRPKLRPLRRFFDLLLGCEIECEIPERLFLGHPYGIIVGPYTELGNNVVLNQQVTLGGKNPWHSDPDISQEFPVLEEGVYVGAGAKILGHVRIGAWSIVGANAVVTRDVPPDSTVVGCNKIVTKG